MKHAVLAVMIAVVIVIVLFFAVRDHSSRGDSGFLVTAECQRYDRVWRTLRVGGPSLTAAKREALSMAAEWWNEELKLHAFEFVEDDRDLDVIVDTSAAKSYTQFEMTSCESVMRTRVYLYDGEAPSKWIGVFSHELGHALFLADDNVAESIMYHRAGTQFFGDVTDQDKARVTARFEE